MEKNKMIIVALIVVILALLAGILLSMPNFAKTDSQLEIISNETVPEGDNLQIRLTDVNGTALANQTVNVTITDNNQTNDYHSVVTNDEGIGSLKLDKSAGNYSVTVNYGGNDGYNSCNVTKIITIEKEVAKAEVSSSASRSVYAYQSDGTPMYSEEEVTNYILHKYGMPDYHIGDNGYIVLDN